MHTSVTNEIAAITDAAAEATALNAVHVISEFVREKGHEELADEIVATFIVTPGDTAEEETTAETETPTTEEEGSQ